MRPLLAILLLCTSASVGFAQVTVEVRQVLSGVSGLETIGGKVFVSPDSKPTVEPVGYVDLGKLPANAQSIKVIVEDADRKSVATERITESQWIILGAGRVWIDARVIDLPSQFLLDESFELVLPSPDPKPDKPDLPIPPIPSDETERIVDNAVLELKRGYGHAFRSAATAISRGEITVDAKLQAFLEPLTRSARINGMAGIDGLIQTKLPRDVDKLKPEAAQFIDNIGLAFERGTK